MINHVKQIQNYSVYNNELTKPIYQQNTAIYSKQGMLQSEVYTPFQKKKQEQQYFIYGKNYDLLSFNGYSVHRMTSEEDPNNKSQMILFNVTKNTQLDEYSLFYYNQLIKLMLFSQRICISKNESSWYTWNQDYSKCTINHNLSGCIDFIIRKNSYNEVFLNNKIINNNTIELDFGNTYNNTQVELVKAFKLQENSSLILKYFIDFDYYKFNNQTIIEIYSQKDNITSFQLSGNYNNVKDMSIQFFNDRTYYVYGNISPQYNDTFYELIVWKIDESNYRQYKNCFTYQKFSSNECNWQLFQNDQNFDLSIPYKFAFTGYNKTHNIDYKAIDETNQFLVQSASGVVDLTTVTNQQSITNKFLYTLQNKELKVLTPDLQDKNLCDFIVVYSSCWSQSYYCDKDNYSYNETWKQVKNINNNTVYSLTLKHNLNGIVKINIRNMRPNLYNTYIIDKNTIQIVFSSEYKIIQTKFFVDLYLIWKEK